MPKKIKLLNNAGKVIEVTEIAYEVLYKEREGFSLYVKEKEKVEKEAEPKKETKTAKTKTATKKKASTPKKATTKKVKKDAK